MADSANMELVFGAKVGASVRRAFSSLTQQITELSKNITAMTASLDKMTGKMDSSSKSVVKQADAANKYSAAVDKVSAATSKLGAFSEQYKRSLATINSHIKNNTAAYNEAVQALSKTEKAYQAMLKPITDMERQEAKLKKAIAATTAEINNGAAPAGAYKNLQRMRKELALLQESIAKKRSVAGQFDYTNAFLGNLNSGYVKQQLAAINSATKQSQSAMVALEKEADAQRRAEHKKTAKEAEALEKERTAVQKQEAKARMLNDREEATAKKKTVADLSRLSREQQAAESQQTRAIQKDSLTAIKAVQSLETAMNDLVLKIKQVGVSDSFSKIAQNLIRTRAMLARNSAAVGTSQYTDMSKALSNSTLNKLLTQNNKYGAQASQALYKYAIGQFDYSKFVAVLKQIAEQQDKANKAAQENIRITQQQTKEQERLATAAQKVLRVYANNDMRMQLTNFAQQTKMQQQYAQAQEKSATAAQKALRAYATKDMGMQIGNFTQQSKYANTYNASQNKATSLSRVANNLTGSIDKMASSFVSMARYMMSSTISMGIIGAFTGAIDAVKEYDQELKNLQAITGATDQEIGILGDKIKQVAVETRYGMTEVAQGAQVIGQAGYDANQTVSILGSTMQLAQGTMSEVKTTADLLTTAIASFGFQAQDAAKVSDIMAVAVNKSKLDIDKLRTAFNYIGPVAQTSGASIQQMTSLLMVLANNGMKASTIGTSLRNVFSQLVSPSKKLREALGNDTDALNTLANPSVNVVDKFRLLNERLGTGADLFSLFGKRAAGTVAILMKYPDQIKEMQESLNEMGISEKMADKQMEGFANRVANLKAAFEVLAVTMFSGTGGMLSSLTLGFTKLVQVITKLADSAVGDAIGRVTTLVASFVALRAVGSVVALLFRTAFVPVLTGISSAAGVLTAALGKMTGALVATQGGLVAASAGGRGFLAVIRMLALHPVIAAVVALGAAIGALSVIISTTTDKEKKNYELTQKRIKQRQEEVGLLRNAIDANDRLTDSTTRMSNNMYLIDKMPDLADLFYSENDKEKTREILTKRLKETQDSIIKDASQVITNAKAKLAELQTARKTLIDNYNKSGNYANAGVSPLLSKDKQEKLRQHNIKAQASKTSEALSVNTEAQKAEQAKIETATSDINNDIRSRVEDIVNDLKRIDKANNDNKRTTKEYADYAVQQYNILIDAQVKAGNIAEEVANKLKEAYKTEMNVSPQAQVNTETFNDSMEKANLNVEHQNALLEKQSDVIKGQLVKAINSYIKKYNELEKAKKEEKEASDVEYNKNIEEQQLALKQELYNKETQIVESNSTIELKLLEERRKREVAAIKEKGKTAKDEAAEVAKVNESVYQQEAGIYEKLIEFLVSGIEAYNNLSIPDKQAVLTAILKMDDSNLTDDQKAMMRNVLAQGGSGLMTAISGLTSTQEGMKKPHAPAGGGKGGRGGNSEQSAAQKRIEALKTQLEYENKLSEVEYKRGNTTYETYKRTELDNELKILEARKEELATVMKSAKNEKDSAKATKAEMDYKKAEAEYELKKIEYNNDIAKHYIEENHKDRLVAIEAEENALESSDNNEAERQNKLAQLSIDKLNDELAGLEKQRELTLSQDESAQLERDIAEKKFEITKAQYELEKQRYDLSTKYIEQEMKYGLKTEEDYKKYLEDSVKRGQTDPYTAAEKYWANSSNPFDGLKLGIKNVTDGIDTFNTHLANLVTSFKDNWDDAIDDFVDSWWDGTESASDIFKDFIENVIKDWQKTLLKAFSDQIFQGIFGNMLGGGGTGANQNGGFNLNGLLGSVWSGLGGLGSGTTNTGTQSVTAATNTSSMALSTNFQNSINNVLASTSNTLIANSNTTSALQQQGVATLENQTTGLFSFLTNGFSNFWSAIGSGLSSLWNMISSVFSSSSSGSGGFWSSFLTNLGTSIAGAFGGSIGSSSSSGVQSVTNSAYKGVASVKAAALKYANGGVLAGQSLHALSGNVVSAPTYLPNTVAKLASGGALIGEAGPEAVMPLQRLGNGKLGVDATGMTGGGCINNITIETPPDTETKQSAVDNNNGGQDIMIQIIKKTAESTSTPGSAMYRAMQNTFGASQALTRR